MMKKYLIVTDLDASFIDENYEYKEAIDAIERISSLGCPLVFNSSKTLIECQALAKELNLTSPVISENGGIITVPSNSELTPLCQASSEQDWQQKEDCTSLITGLSIDYILSHAHQIREEYGYDFAGFSDWSPQQLMEITGLSEKGAELAKQRQVRALRGGKFIHLMGDCDKSDGLKVTKELYQQKYPDDEWVTIAIGDSDNDLSMLESADIAIVIPHSSGFKIQVNGAHVIQAKSPSSKGWNDALLSVLPEHNLTHS